MTQHNRAYEDDENDVTANKEYALSLKVIKLSDSDDNTEAGVENQMIGDKEESEEKLQVLWNKYLGDCTSVTQILKKKPLDLSLWGFAHFSNIFLRSVGQTVFVNNPVLSFLILVGITFSWPESGLGCAVGGVLATLTELCLGLHPWSLVESGVAPFNGALVGCVLPSLYPLLHGTGHAAGLWLAVCLGSVACTFCAAGCNNFLDKFNLPFMTLPFNIISICTFLTLLPSQDDGLDSSSAGTLTSSSPAISWAGIGEGILLSMGQVYAVNNMLGSCLIMVAAGLYSPRLLCVAMIGAAIGCLVPLMFLPPALYHQIYQGLWGYNPLLSMAAASCVFTQWSWASLLAGSVNTVSTVFIQRALATIMLRVGLPVFTLPFVLSTLFILSSWQQRGWGREL